MTCDKCGKDAYRKTFFEDGHYEILCDECYYDMPNHKELFWTNLKDKISE